MPHAGAAVSGDHMRLAGTNLPTAPAREIAAMRAEIMGLSDEARALRMEETSLGTEARLEAVQDPWVVVPRAEKPAGDDAPSEGRDDGGASRVAATGGEDVCAPQAPAGEGRVEGFGGLADQADVVHASA